MRLAAVVGEAWTDEKPDTVGAVRSMVMLEPVAAAVGPELPAASTAPSAAKRGTRVPSEQLVIVTVREAPEPVPGSKAQPVAVPVFDRSPAATPVTASENVRVYSSAVALVGDAVTAVSDAVGAVRSIVIVVADVAAVAGPVLPAPSLAPPAANSGITVPAVQFVMVTVRDAPASVPGAKVHDAAVPVFEKSPAATPVTDSENVRVYVKLVALVGEAWALVKPVTVGAVVSRVIVAPVAATAGPPFDARSLAPPAAKRGMIVPSLQPVIVTVREASESVPGEKLQPVAVPVCEKSPAATPVTDSENVSVYVSVEAFVGDEVTAVNDDTVGAVMSRVTVSPSAAVAGPVLATASVAPFAAKRGMIVPSPQPVIVTVRDVPESVLGSNTQEAAVPVLEKSPAATPVTVRENVSVYEMEAAFVGDEVTAVNDDTVGAAASRAIVGPSAIVAGPVLPAASVAPFAAKCGMIVPAEQLVSVTVRIAPASVSSANTQPVAVPVCVKSPAATPVTDSENVSV